MNTSTIISPATAIQRLKTFCSKNGYTVSSKDPEAIQLTDHILSCLNVQDPADRYTVYFIYNDTEAIKAEGSLIEMMYDFDLLAKNEALESDWVFTGNKEFLRRDKVRLPWLRYAD